MANTKNQNLEKTRGPGNVAGLREEISTHGPKNTIQTNPPNSGAQNRYGPNTPGPRK